MFYKDKKTVVTSERLASGEVQKHTLVNFEFAREFFTRHISNLFYNGYM